LPVFIGSIGLCYNAKYRQDGAFPAGLPVFFGSIALCSGAKYRQDEVFPTVLSVLLPLLTLCNSKIPTRWSGSGRFAGIFRLERPQLSPASAKFRNLWNYIGVSRLGAAKRPALPEYCFPVFHGNSRIAYSKSEFFSLTVQNHSGIIRLDQSVYNLHIKGST